MAQKKKAVKTASRKKTNTNQKPLGQKSNRSEKQIKRIYEIELVVLISTIVIFALALHTDSVGLVGKLLKSISFGLFSKGGYLIPYTLFGLIFLKLNKNLEPIYKRLMAAIITLFISLNFMYTITRFNEVRFLYTDQSMKLFSLSGIKLAFTSGIEFESGGLFNNLLSIMLYSTIGRYGLLIVTITLFVISMILITNFKFKNILKKKDEKKPAAEKTKKKAVVEKKPNPIQEPVFEPINAKPAKKPEKDIKIFNYSDFNQEEEKIEVAVEVDDKKIVTELNKNVQTKIENYVKPKLSLLKKPTYQADHLDKSEIIKKAEVLERTLTYFGIDAKVMEINKGPTITRYEIQPKPGTKISKIVGLQDDLALNLAVSQVRVAPVPGKVAVGIEVPNEENSMVKIREILESNEFRKAKSKLTIALGKNISGQPVVTDLSVMPHLLIAGATGSGKSVCVNSIITSILYNATPEEVKLLMIDPKVVELNVYNGIPHLILPVVTEPKKASIALGWAVNEMARRYDLFAESQVRDIESYNRKNEAEKMPQIVVIIDELADLMMVAPNQVEEAIARLAQMARAAGIHLIVATQRPSVDVITGLIKANITSRIAFSVSAQVDSRTILDMGGAEKLLGKGDMLFNPIGAPKPIRLQGAYISEDEIEKIVNHVKSQSGEVTYNTEILKETEQLAHLQEADELMPTIIKYLANEKTISISKIQRDFKIGYNRSARIVSDLEERGILGPSKGSKPRDVIMTIEQMEEFL